MIIFGRLTTAISSAINNTATDDISDQIIIAIAINQTHIPANIFVITVILISPLNEFKIIIVVY